MKNLFLSLVLVMVGLVANSQVITVTLTKCQNFTHDSNISTVEAMDSNLIEYPYYTEGENIYTFDLNQKIVTLKNSNNEFFTYNLIEINDTKNILNCIAFDGIGNILFLAGKDETGEQQFLIEWFDNDKIVGVFSMNSDFTYTIK